MKLLLFIIAFVLHPSATSIDDYNGDYAGTWTYAIDTPDGKIEGSLVLTYEDEEYGGKLTAYGQEYPITDVEQEGNELNFKTNAAGYSSVIKGSFDGDVYSAIIFVEGMQIPLKATRSK